MVVQMKGKSEWKSGRGAKDRSLARGGMRITADRSRITRRERRIPSFRGPEAAISRGMKPKRTTTIREGSRSPSRLAMPQQIQERDQKWRTIGPTRQPAMPRTREPNLRIIGQIRIRRRSRCRGTWTLLSSSIKRSNLLSKTLWLPTSCHSRPRRSQRLIPLQSPIMNLWRSVQFTPSSSFSVSNRRTKPGLSTCPSLTFLTRREAQTSKEAEASTVKHLCQRRTSSTSRCRRFASCSTSSQIQTSTWFRNSCSTGSATRLPSWRS